MNLFKKKEKIEEDKYYTLDRILEHSARYNMIFGERSSGKTYAALKYALQKYFEDGSEFAYIRRWEEDFRGKRGASLFDALVANGEIEKLSRGRWNSMYYYAGRFWLSKYDQDEAKRTNSPTPCGYAFALSTMEHDKSSSYPNIRTVIFDEFLTRTTYIPDEFVVFCNVLSTIIRDRQNVEIFMLGNTVNKYCPYFSEMGLKNIKKMVPGQIDIYSYGDSGLTVAVEYTGGGHIRREKASDFYFAFDNPKLQMITGGAWELDIYPHCPMKFGTKDIKRSYFIDFDNELVQCDIVKIGKVIFTYIHKKTTPIKDEYKDIVFSTTYKPQKNWRRRIDKPFDEIGQIIWKQFQTYSVYYQDNDVGDFVKNYLEWCKQQ